MTVVRKCYRGLQGIISLQQFNFFDCIGRLYNRLNGDYEVLHGLCRFFLEQSGPMHSSGDHMTFPFLIDMAHLYELFVAEWLREHLPEGYSSNSIKCYLLRRKPSKLHYSPCDL